MYVSVWIYALSVEERVYGNEYMLAGLYRSARIEMFEKYFKIKTERKATINSVTYLFSKKT